MAPLWRAVVPPLRPSREDVDIFHREVLSWRGNDPAPRALLLGVTPELYRLAWLPGTHLLAIDNARSMLERVWPGPRERALCGDWMSLPLADGSRDVVVCDGGFSMIAYPRATRLLAEELRRVLTFDGLFVVRMYVRPEFPETTRAIIDDLRSGRIRNQSELKLRFWTSIEHDVELGLRLGDVWEAIHRTEPEIDRLFERLGWGSEQRSLIDAYRNCETRYYFPARADIVRLLCEAPGGFAIQSIHTPRYTLGERCPIVAFRRKSARAR